MAVDTDVRHLRRVPAGDLPPHDLELERDVLGSCVIHPQLLTSLELTTADFWGDRHRLIWFALQGISADGEPVDTSHLRQRLIELGKLPLAGGDEYLLELTDRIPSANPPADILRKLRKQRDLQALSRRLDAASEAGDFEAAAKALDGARELLARDQRPAPEPLDGIWKSLGEWAVFDAEPPPRRWLLERPDAETNGARHVGVFALGKVGMLISPGGVGKTMALVQLALSVATGRKWFDHFVVSNPGPVLLALGEEDPEEIWRRVYATARAMRLTDHQVELAARNVIALPLAGTHVALVDDDNAEPPMLTALRKRLGSGVNWRLLILDPLSRFAGTDTETDNAAATRFIQVVESLVKAPGAPAALIAHHTNKASRSPDGAQASASDARGVSGLTDGGRWTANLERKADDLVEFTVTKSNYSMLGDPLTLYRDADHGGYMRVQTQAEATARVARVSEKHKARMTTIRDLVLRCIHDHPGVKSGNDIYRVIGGNRAQVQQAFNELKVDGYLEVTRTGIRMTKRSGLDG